MPVILLGDIGGTNARIVLATLERINGKELFLKTANYRNFEEVLEDATAQLGPFDAFCMGVAGPVEDGKPVRLPLVDWMPIHLEAVKRRFSLKSATLVNDMVAVAHGINAQHRGSQSDAGASNGNFLVVSIGTSVGKIRCRTLNNILHLFPSEACHTILPVSTREHAGIFEKIIAEFGLVYPLNCSEIVSGIGLERLFWALTGRRTAINDIASLGADDPDFSLLKGIFNEILGSLLHCWILDAVPVDAIYIAGGVVDKMAIIDVEAIRASFIRQKMLRENSESVQIVVLKDDRLGLKGAHVIANTLNMKTEDRK